MPSSFLNCGVTDLATGLTVPDYAFSSAALPLSLPYVLSWNSQYDVNFSTNDNTAQGAFTTPADIDLGTFFGAEPVNYAIAVTGYLSIPASPSDVVMTFAVGVLGGYSLAIQGCSSSNGSTCDSSATSQVYTGGASFSTAFTYGGLKVVFPSAGGLFPFELLIYHGSSPGSSGFEFAWAPGDQQRMLPTYSPGCSCGSTGIFQLVPTTSIYSPDVQASLVATPAGQKVTAGSALTFTAVIENRGTSPAYPLTAGGNGLEYTLALPSAQFPASSITSVSVNGGNAQFTVVSTVYNTLVTVPFASPGRSDSTLQPGGAGRVTVAVTATLASTTPMWQTFTVQGRVRGHATDPALVGSSVPQTIYVYTNDPTVSGTGVTGNAPPAATVGTTPTVIVQNAGDDDDGTSLTVGDYTVGVPQINPATVPATLISGGLIGPLPPRDRTPLRITLNAPQADCVGTANNPPSYWTWDPVGNTCACRTSSLAGAWSCPVITLPNCDTGGCFTATATVQDAWDAAPGLSSSLTFPPMPVVGPAATTLIVGPASGTYAGTTNLSAVLTATSRGTAVTGQTVSFSLNGNSVGSAITDATGTATLNNVSIAGINAGACNSCISASFAGTASYGASSGSNSLTVSQATTTISISNIPGSPVYGGSFTPTFAYIGDGKPSVTSTGTCTVNPSTGAVSFAGAGTCSLTAHASQGTNYKATDGSPQSFTINQRPSTLTLSGPSSVVFGTCTAQTFKTVLSDTLTSTALSGQTIAFTIGSQTGTATTDATGTATLSLALNQPVGNITAAAAYAGTVTQAAVTSNSLSIAIIPAPAGPTPGNTLYTGSTLFWTSSSSSSTASLTLSATIQDVSGLSCGDVRTAKVTFGFRNSDGSVTPIPSAQHLPVGLVSPSDITTGTASAIVQYNIGGLSVDQLQIAVLLEGNYTLNTELDDTLITIALPSQANEMIANGAVNLLAAPLGAGYLDSGNGAIASGPAGYLQVQASVAWNKSYTNPKGGATLIVNTYNKPDGTLDSTLHTYLITSTSIASLTAPVPGSVLQFTAKAVVQDVTNPAAIVGVDGGCTLQLTTTNPTTAYPNGEVNVSVIGNKGNLWIAGGWNGAQSVNKGLVTGTVLGQ
jgi:hypothetical protein